ncbi:hypothetical protein A9179_00380 [Pseudomonas alcaligenes]|uniref:YjiS-like domain-containing protein n=1 Tax=Aquipseudomonas alcaligenes TaxID=43263 RepID=A0ABR7RUB4_AQUAC|nr:DUF1127 domain-containing protein [Pseudomonas alcaligenes]MBC9248720.1 hypothetical protein [Pseudomonas alcaligenes]
MERTLGSDLIHQHSATNLLDTLLLWQRRIISRRELAKLDERLLSDAGISLYQREAEIRKPFWR